MSNQYTLKQSLITPTENLYYRAIIEALPEGYLIFPQINLAAIIEKSESSKYRSELFRNVDFLITDDTYKPKIVIEINDRTHHLKERRKRDKKVREICAEANIPIINLWTSYGVDQSYIKKKIEDTLHGYTVSEDLSSNEYLKTTDSPRNTEPKPFDFLIWILKAAFFIFIKIPLKILNTLLDIIFTPNNKKSYKKHSRKRR